jgi:hypothetical protein
MHPAISYELATARIADLRRQAQRDALTLFTGVSIALLWTAFTTTRLITIRSLPCTS